ncbi:hypothetical protein ACQEVG_16105 [Streptomyces sp. CA-135486]
MMAVRETIPARRSVWEEFMEFDAVLARIGEGADARLDFQASYPVHG